MKSIQDFPLATFRLGLWRLGHAGVVIRYRDGPVIVIDPYLSNAAAATSPRLTRRFPPPIPPEQLDAELVVISSARRDHLDPDTLGPSQARRHATFLGSAGVASQLMVAGTPPERTVRLEPGRVWHSPACTVTPRPTIHATALSEELGIVLEPPGGGPRVYCTGETLDGPALDATGPVDLLVAPINGKFGDMGVEGAARLAGALPARWVVPVQYDLMAANGEDPEAFLHAMEREGLGARARVLPVLQPLLLDARGEAVTVTGPLEMEWSTLGAVRTIELPHGYRLRHFRDADLPELGLLYSRVFGADHSEAWYRRVVMDASHFSPDRVMIVESGGRVVASALAWEDDTHHAGGRGLLRYAATHPDHHQRGLGKAVCAGVQKYFKDRNRRGVLVRTDDWRLRSIRAFMTLGFVALEGTPEARARWANVRAAVETAVTV